MGHGTPGSVTEVKHVHDDQLNACSAKQHSPTKVFGHLRVACNASTAGFSRHIGSLKAALRPFPWTAVSGCLRCKVAVNIENQVGEIGHEEADRTACSRRHESGVRHNVTLRRIERRDQRLCLTGGPGDRKSTRLNYSHV